MKRLAFICSLFVALAVAAVSFALPSQTPLGEDPAGGGVAAAGHGAGFADTTFAVSCQGARMIAWALSSTNAAACSLFTEQFSMDSTNWVTEVADKDSTMTQTFTAALLGHSLATPRIAVTVPVCPLGTGGTASEFALPYIPWKWARAIITLYGLTSNPDPAGLKMTPTVYFDTQQMGETSKRPYLPDR